MNRFGYLALMSTTALVMSAQVVEAQQIVSAMRGTITDAQGQAISGATVTITDTRIGSTRTTTTNAQGIFAARNLSVGGPYTVTVEADGFQGKSVEGVFVTLGTVTRITLDLQQVSGDISAETITVLGTRETVSRLAVGPNSNFNTETLESFPSINRDFRDIIRIDPRVSLERSGDGVDQISCIGGNNRFNTVTIDGVLVNDSFGLNGTGFAARNVIPLPFDAIRETSVEFAPFDVEYGQFTGCNINLVSKTGTNEFSGAAFAVYETDSLTSTTIEGRDVDLPEFDNYNWGASIGGPVIEDKLFFFVAYEETRNTNVQEQGPGAGFPTQIDFLTVEQANEIQRITQDVYGLDNQGIARGLENETRRILTRWDWQIDDGHRLEFTYQRLREVNQEQENINSNNFHFLSTFEEEGTTSEFYSARLFNQWTDRFSTEVRLSRFDYQDNQGPIGGGEAQDETPIPRLLVYVENPENGLDGLVQAAGPGIFRSANQLNTQQDRIRFKSDYVWGRHTFTAGYEYDQLDVFNLFIINATGNINFLSIEDFANGVIATGTNTNPFAGDTDFANGSVAGFTGNGSFTGDPTDAAADYRRTIHTFYLQDEFEATSELSLVLGLRWDYYLADEPLRNRNFIARYGFSNQNSIDDKSLLQPRFGIAYNPDWAPNTTFRGGVGRFSGGDPTVWISNAYQNFGGAIGSGGSPGCAEADRTVFDASGRFTGIPSCVVDQQIEQATQQLSDTQSTDPDFEIPSVWRANFGFTHVTDFDGFAGGFFDNWTAQIDVIYSRFQNPADWIDLSLTPDIFEGLNGFAIDGRPIYDNIDPTVDGCTAEFISPRQGYRNVNGPCFATGRDDEIFLTNSEGFGSTTFSVLLAKEFEYDLFEFPSRIFVNTGYAFTDANSRRDSTSSTATSSFSNTAVFDFQNVPVASSNFENRHNATLAATFETEFWRDFPTRINMFFSARSGRPYSYTFDGGYFSSFRSGSDNSLVYVPTGIDDPNISPESNADDLAAYNRFISQDECLSEFRGRTLERNSCRNGWFMDIDIRFQQFFPGFLEGHRSIFYIDIDNLGNLISSEANIFRSFSSEEQIIDADRVDSAGRYVLDDFENPNPRAGDPDGAQSTSFSASRWRVQLGFRYEF